jgi:ABC-type spermidine/putrescine transport system permease subunit II
MTRRDTILALIAAAVALTVGVVAAVAYARLEDS